MSFVGLHIHSDYSLLDGASQLPDLIDRAVELGMPAIALTDHGVMYGAIELLKVCSAKGVKPIIGNEMYVINGDITKQERRSRFHQVVLAKNTQGYKNLVKITTISHLKGMQGKGIFSRPCISKDLLRQYREGLIVTSACLGGEIPQALIQGRPDVARRIAQEYKDIFGDDYYLEIQDHGLKEERIVNPEIVRIARELDIKLIATNDSHYISCYDVEAHDALLCIQTGKLIAEDKRLRYTGTEYLKSAEEMRRLFRDHLPQDVIDEAIANTLEVAGKVEEYTGLLGEPRIPNYPIPEGYTAETYLTEVTQQGLVERLECGSFANADPTYCDRLDYELRIMKQMGFSTYFLVVWDYIKFARDQGIPVGPGRGSAAGSLVAYALGITNIDPVHHGLLFERFLNPERKSMPDIDTDFCISRRDEVIRYVTDKYGEERVAQIITFNRMTSKAVLKDVARVLDIPYGDADRMAKMIPVFRGKPAKLKTMISDKTPAPEFKERYEKDDQVRKWLDMAMRIEGTNKTYGVHAAGVVISSEPLDEIVPLQRNNDGAVITQYFMEDIEAMGLLKMDFLGLKNLTMIQRAVELVQQNQNIALDIDRLPLDNPQAYQLLARGELGGIFQLESSGMRQIVRDLKPSGLEDISSVLALYRPGPLDAGLIPKFINRKHGREKIDYAHELLQPILKETYGIMVYQEQIMKIAQDVAGYSLGQADLLRRCLSGSTEIVDASTGKITSLKQIAEHPDYWIGRPIFSLDPESQKIIQKPIAEIYRNGVQDVWEITTKTHRKIRATQHHLFYTVLGWKSLKNFQVGDRIGVPNTLSLAHISSISDDQIKLPAYWSEDRYLSTRQAVNSSSNSALALIEDVNPRAAERSDVFWDEIVAIAYVGKEEVFDLTIPDTHNFIANDFIAHNCMGKKKPAEMQKHQETFIDGATDHKVPKRVAEELWDQMVQFAEYCFNKSHSTAYGYVTYQTAYLKANYPREYMAALLTANCDDHAKVHEYISTCLKMGIQVEPPNINRSGIDFTPSDTSILFGLSAVRNVGQGAIECILASREESGLFQSLADLCDRIDSRSVNRRALEALIHCGAMDCLNPNRQQLIRDLDLVLDWAQGRARDRQVGQGNLFDILGGTGSGAATASYESAPKAPPTDDFPPQEKLRLEKELLGFYISDHPLKSIRKAASILAPINLNQLAEQPDNMMLSAIVLLSSVKPVTTKKGDRMAVVQLEDLTGEAEGVVFPKYFERIQQYIQPDARLMIWGRVDRRDDRTQFIVEDVEPIEEVRMVMVELSPQIAGDISQQQRLKTVLISQQGDEENSKVPVVAMIASNGQRQFVRLGAKFRVADPRATVNALRSAGFEADASTLIQSESPHPTNGRSTSLVPR